MCCSIFIGCKETPKEAPTATLPQFEEVTSTLPIERLNLPEGFTIEVYADGLDGARSMAMGDHGTLFVGTRNENTVYAVQDLDNDLQSGSC